MHAMNIFRTGFHPHQNNFAPLGLGILCIIGCEHDSATGSTWRCRKTLRQNVALCSWINCWMQQLVKRRRIDAQHGFVAADQSFCRHIRGNLQRRFGGALARAGLQHPQFTFLDGKFQILHVAVMRFKLVADCAEFRKGLRHFRLKRGLLRARLQASGFGQVLRRADAGHNIFALGIDQKLAIERFLSGRWIARKGDTGSGIAAHIAEHHGLHIDRRPPVGGNVVDGAIGNGARCHPGLKHRPDPTPELILRVLRKRRFQLTSNQILVV